MQYRIGDRDAVTGLYDVIWPDGSFTRNGLKIFNSEHQFGDAVLATQRSDGMMLLDSVKAAAAATVTELAVRGFGEKPVGYLAGQVFNNEEEVILPVVSIEFAPGSPEELEPGAGDFVVRIKIDRPQRKDLSVKCELTGTAASADYTVSGLDGDLIAVIAAGELFFDVVITPTQNQSGANKTVDVKVIQDHGYRVGQNSATATIVTGITPLTYLINRQVAVSNAGIMGIPGEAIRIGGKVADGNELIALIFKSVDSQGNLVPIQGSDLAITYYLIGGAVAGIHYSSASNTGLAIIPVGESSATVHISPIISSNRSNKGFQVFVSGAGFTTVGPAPVAILLYRQMRRTYGEVFGFGDEVVYESGYSTTTRGAFSVIFLDAIVGNFFDVDSDRRINFQLGGSALPYLLPSLAYSDPPDAIFDGISLGSVSAYNAILFFNSNTLGGGTIGGLPLGTTLTISLLDGEYDIDPLHGVFTIDFL